MKIAHVTPVYPPYRGGIGTVAQDYATALREVGEEVTVFTPAYKRGLAGEEKGHVERLAPLLQYGNAALVPGLFFRLKEVDVIHLHYPFYGGALLAALAAFVWRKPLMLTYHMKTKARGWVGMFFAVHRVFIEPIIFRIAKAVFVSSLDYARASGVKHRNLIEQPFWVDAERFSPGSSPYVREFFGLSSSSPIFLFVGGLDDAHYFKGLEVLLEACSLLPKDMDWNVVIAGGGNQLARYQAIALERELAGRVHFPGRVSDEGLPNLFKESDAHLLPSIDRSEAFGVVTLEAGASGIPSIVSDLPGVRTLVVEGETGHIVPPGDAHALAHSMKNFLIDLPHVREMGAAARVRVLERYSKERLVQRLRDAYAGDTVGAL